MIRWRVIDEYGTSQTFSDLGEACRRYAQLVDAAYTDEDAVTLKEEVVHSRVLSQERGTKVWVPKLEPSGLFPTITARRGGVKYGEPRKPEEPWEAAGRALAARLRSAPRFHCMDETCPYETNVRSEIRDHVGALDHFGWYDREWKTTT